MIENEAGAKEVERHLRNLADEARIAATPRVAVATDVQQTIHAESRNAAIVIMGFEAPQENEERAFFDRMEQWAGPLPRVVFVDSIGEMSLES